jgi:hypothetical protein
VKPAVCVLCGKAAIDTPSPNNGDWVEFADYRAQDPVMLGHPIGLEYFCDEHVAAAKHLTSKPSTEVLAQLREQLGDLQKYTTTSPRQVSWWQRLFPR